MSKSKITLGYARVSTPKQKVRRQIDSITEYCKEAVIIEETYTGTSFKRPEWTKILKLVEKGEVSCIIFDEISRMSRDAEEGYKTYKYFLEKGVEMVFLREPHLNSKTYYEARAKKIDIKIESGDKYTDEFLNAIMDNLNQYMLNLVERQIEIAFERSQAEVDYIRARTKAGLAAAKARGAQIGRQPGTHIETKKYKKCARIIYQNYKLFGGKLYASSCCKLCDGIARSTFYRYVHIMLESGKYSVPPENVYMLDNIENGDLKKYISGWEMRRQGRENQAKTQIKKNDGTDTKNCIK